MAVTPNTAVTWEWTGRGGDHNVVSPTDLFDSGETVGDGDATVAYTPDQTGVSRYVREPHADIGMRGAVFVALE